MTVAAQVIVALASVGALTGVMTFVRRVAQEQAWPAELQRKLIHICTGLYALALPWLFDQDWPIYLLLGLSIVVLTGLRLAKSGLGGVLHDVRRTSYGDYLLVIAIGLVLLLSGRDMLLYALPLAVLTLSDAAAALAGSTYGRRFYTVEGGQKSFEGSAVFFLVTLVIAMSMLILTQPQAGSETIVLAFLIAVFGTQFEADSWRGFDNLFLPLGLLIILQNHRDSSVDTLFVLAAIYLGALLVMPVLSRVLGVTQHVARVYLIAFFLVLSATTWSTAVLPTCVLLAHLITRRLAPSQDAYPELDVVAALALISFGWLALGNAVSFNAVGYYLISCAGLTAGLMVLGHRTVGLICAPLLVGATLVFMPMSGAPLPDMSLGLSVLAVAATTGMALAGASWFDRLRLLKLSLIAIVVPAAGFALHIREVA